MSLFSEMQMRLSSIQRELGALDTQIAKEKITNPAHTYKKRQIALEAQADLLTYLMNRDLELRKEERHEKIG